jgi:signal transduction histidine kinase
VIVETAGHGADLPPAVDLAAFRVVQESLTNVRKHAAASSAHVRIEHRPGELVVTVTDDGRGPPPEPPGRPGFGLVGMRERVTGVGGRVAAEGLSTGGFRVRAAFPLDS